MTAGEWRAISGPQLPFYLVDPERQAVEAGRAVERLAARRVRRRGHQQGTASTKWDIWGECSFF
jgi:hypothetical protein